MPVVDLAVRARHTVAMATSKRPRSKTAERPELGSDYWSQSQSPLTVLIFLLPLIAAYELAIMLVLRNERGVITNKAHQTLYSIFEAAGVTGLGWYLPGILIVVVLFTWHLLKRDRWLVNVRHLGLMAIEACVLTIPLLVFAQLIARSGLLFAPAQPIDPQSLSLIGRIAVSVGAGLYEELVFRMLLIGFIHTIMHDVAKLSDARSNWIAILISAICFTIYHPLADPSGALVPGRVIFFLAAGIFFGWLFLKRGFGIVVAVHALYDIVTVLLPGS